MKIVVVFQGKGVKTAKKSVHVSKITDLEMV